MVLLPDGTRTTPTPGRFARFLQFLSANPALPISLASLVVAGASLWLAYTVQSRDAYYKELSITPLLVLNLDSSFTLRMRNVGLGPALIKEWALQFDGKCYRAEKLNDAKINELTGHLTNRLLHDVLKDLPSPFSPANPFFAEYLMIQPGAHLDRGEESIFFRLAPEDAARINEALKKLSQARYTEITTRFARAVSELPIVVEFCSISGKTCSKFGTVQCS
jgi:hypothetical protein